MRFVTAGLASTIATIDVPVAIVYNHFYHCHNRHRNIWVTLICGITPLPDRHAFFVYTNLNCLPWNPIVPGVPSQLG